MEKSLSDKIKIVSFVSMIMVVILHGYNLDMNDELYGNSRDFNFFIQNFVSYGLTRIAVPIFFILSGYLYAYNQQTCLNSYLVKTRKRIRSLIIPFLLWCLLGMLFYLILQSIPQAQPFFTKKLIKDYDFHNFVNSLLVEPIPYQLWFLRDLIVMVLISPIIIFCVTRAKLFFLFLAFVLWFQNIDSFILTSEAFLFFSVGLYLSFFKRDLLLQDLKNGKQLMLGWVIVLLVKTSIMVWSENDLWERTLLKISIIIGIFAFWIGFDCIKNHFLRKKFLLNVSKFSFFIYLSHEPLLTIVKKALFFFTGKTEITHLIVFFLAPIITIVTSIFAGKLLKMYFKKVYLFSTGGR